MNLSNKILAFWVVALVLYIVVGLIFGLIVFSTDKQTVQKVATQTIYLDYMYADWCEYCPQTSKDLQEVVSEFSDSVQLRFWNEAQRTEDVTTNELYQKYKKEQLFGGFPTIVANEKQMLVGARNKEQIKMWICEQFEQDKRPIQCKEITDSTNLLKEHSDTD